MSLVSQYRIMSTPVALFKVVALTAAVISTVVLTGCASKPQVNQARSYAAAPEFYTVRSGDTLSGIASRYGMNYLNIAALNDIEAPYRIYVGQSLRLKGQPVRREVQTAPQAATTTQIQRQSIALPSTQQSAPVTSAQPRPVQAAPSASTLKATSQLTWVKPSNGAVFQHYDLSKNVKGTRYSGIVGDPVFAAAAGQVVYAADGLKEYGNLVLIKHVNGYITAYAHNNKMLVKSGDNVTAGQKIAEMGSTGTSRIMLEFQVRLDGKPINPLTVLPNS